MDNIIIIALGDIGVQGDSGVLGDTGASGLLGDKGSLGEKGSDGRLGPRGPQAGKAHQFQISFHLHVIVFLCSVKR